MDASQGETMPRESLSVRINGVQGTLMVAAEDKGEDGKLLWIGPDDEVSLTIGVDPEDLKAAIAFVLGERLGP